MLPFEKSTLCWAWVPFSWVTGESPPVGMELSLPLSAFHTLRLPPATGLTTTLWINSQADDFRCDVSLQSRTGRLPLNFQHLAPPFNSAHKHNLRERQKNLPTGHYADQISCKSTGGFFFKALPHCPEAYQIWIEYGSIDSSGPVIRALQSMAQI